MCLIYSEYQYLANVHSVTFRILSFRSLPIIPQKKSTLNFPQITRSQRSSVTNTADKQSKADPFQDPGNVCSCNLGIVLITKMPVTFRFTQTMLILTLSLDPESWVMGYVLDFPNNCSGTSMIYWESASLLFRSSGPMQFNRPKKLNECYLKQYQLVRMCRVQPF